MTDVRVLIVMWSVDLREAIEKAILDTAKHSWFASFKFEIITAKSGSDWFSKLGGISPNIIIADSESSELLLHYGRYKGIPYKEIEKKPLTLIFDFAPVPAGGLSILGEIKQQYEKNIAARFKITQKGKVSEHGQGDKGTLSQIPHHLEFPTMYSEFKGRTNPPRVRQRPV
ncbi:MAG: hypothetical protein AB1468_04575 [Candidatus Micrarchaeota archaeon]